MQRSCRQLVNSCHIFHNFLFLQVPITAGWTKAVRSLPETCTHSHQWESNPRPFDQEPDAQIIYLCTPRSMYRWMLYTLTQMIASLSEEGMFQHDCNIFYEVSETITSLHYIQITSNMGLIISIYPVYIHNSFVSVNSPY